VNHFDVAAAVVVVVLVVVFCVLTAFFKQPTNRKDKIKTKSNQTF